MDPVSGRNTMSGGMKDARHYQKYTFSRIAPFLGRRVVDIGCAFGVYTRMLLDRGCSVLAMDVDPECVESCRKTLAGLDCEFHRGDISDPSSLERIATFKPDTVVMLQVLEHVENDSGLLRDLARGLGPAGRLVVTVPAFQGLFGPMDSQAGHYRRYSRASLAGCAESSGWTVERIFYYNPVGGLGWWVNNRLLRRWTSLDSGHVNLQIDLFDRLVLPLSKALDRFSGGFFGQSLLMVAHPREQETDN